MSVCVCVEEEEGGGGFKEKIYFEYSNLATCCYASVLVRFGSLTWQNIYIYSSVSAFFTNQKH